MDRSRRATGRRAAASCDGGAPRLIATLLCYPGTCVHHGRADRLAEYHGGFTVNPPIGCSWTYGGPAVSPPYTREISINQARIYRSPKPGYATSTQTLWTRQTAQYFSPATGWTSWANSGWITRTAAPGQLFTSPYHAFPIYSGGYSWRIVSEYVWSVGMQDSERRPMSMRPATSERTRSTSWGGAEPSAIGIGTYQGTGYCTIY